MKIADRKFIDAVTGEVKKVGDLFKEITELKRKLNEVKDYVYSHVDFDKDDSIRSKTAGYDILEIIGKI